MLKGKHNTFPILITERLTLRQLSIHDDQRIFTLRSDVNVNKYLDRPISNTIDDARDFITKIIKSSALYWVITLHNPNILIGTICLFGFSDENRACELGYELLPEFHRQGIMQEAVAKVIDYAFHVIKVAEIKAYLHKENISSVKLLEKFLFLNSDEPVKENPDILCYHLTNSIK
ncbi:GNAT family N-acetyltransferase [Sediminibacterium ginsengisoli]|uniref:Ribosomal-protein-alanine N-acetyltransferase n=1 Tax=Sediminibacterium ginsengisoli TaxID=413434 RepID=A0A1T4JP53_9BACT|nr:GNAT family N-acetyltransferase [Sediminibacterium ginsengisoli]SJZ31938.1 ribosomal-protein-alanine N-acetyltransferase [Sediminibacterium ginsengisoli]